MGLVLWRGRYVIFVFTIKTFSWVLEILQVLRTMMKEKCECIEISGHLEAVKWSRDIRNYRPSPGDLALGDWKRKPFIWLYYVESADQMNQDDVLRSTDTRYWSIHDVQRYFFGDLHCERVLFTYQYPNLRMPTHLGSYLWKANTALKLPPQLYMKELHVSIETTLKKLEATEAQMDRIIISDQLIKLNRMDYQKRNTFFRILHNILSFQDNLQLVSFENMCCTRLEGVGLLEHLACFNARSLKYLFLWRFVLSNENPILINYSYISGSGQYIPRPSTKQCFLRSLGELRNLRVLALEYTYLADGTGNALLALLPVLKRPHFRLQLLCREDQVPGRTDAALGVGGYDIPDTTWRRITIACPDLYLFMAFFRIHDYDNVRRFLSPSLPLRETHLQLGIDIRMKRQHSDLSCFIRHIAYRYSCSLNTLSIHQWRFEELPMHRLFELMPFLVRFIYVGRISEKQLCAALTLVACGVCEKLKQLSIQIEDDERSRIYWKKVVENLTEEYKDIMQLFDIDFCLAVYKH